MRVYSKMAGHMESPDEQQRRLIITDMVLENFKSYAGEQRVGPFHKVSSLFLPLLCFIAIPFNRRIQAIAPPALGSTCSRKCNLLREGLTLPKCCRASPLLLVPMEAANPM